MVNEKNNKILTNHSFQKNLLFSKYFFIHFFTKKLDQINT